jgi:hypothetical protein
MMPPPVRKPKAKKHHVYFTDQTQLSIIKYTSDDRLTKVERDSLYVGHIMPAFEQLVRININDGKFHYTGMDLELLVDEILLHLYEILNASVGANGYSASTGRAYAYFNRCAKNKLIQLQKKHQLKIKKYGLESVDVNLNYFKENIPEDKGDIVIGGFEASEFLDMFTDHIRDNISDFVDRNKTDEKIIAEVILKILTDDMSYIYNKKLLYVIVKQHLPCETYKINKVLNKIKDRYFQLKEEYIQRDEMGYDDPDDPDQLFREMQPHHI